MLRPSMAGWCSDEALRFLNREVSVFRNKSANTVPADGSLFHRSQWRSVCGFCPRQSFTISLYFKVWPIGWPLRECSLQGQFIVFPHQGVCSLYCDLGANDDPERLSQTNESRHWSNPPVDALTLDHTSASGTDWNLNPTDTFKPKPLFWANALAFSCR